MSPRRTRSGWQRQCDRAYREALAADREWAEIPLTRGKATKIDIADWPRVAKAGPWNVLRTAKGDYAKHDILIGDKWTTELLSRFLLSPRDGQDVDHANHDTLDNRRSNLRLCSRGQNCANRRKQKGLSSRFKGVTWHQGARRWMARISRRGQETYLGLFDTEKEAAQAYNVAAKDLWGEFAHINRIS